MEMIKLQYFLNMKGIGRRMGSSAAPLIDESDAGGIMMHACMHDAS